MGNTTGKRKREEVEQEESQAIASVQSPFKRSALKATNIFFKKNTEAYLASLAAKKAEKDKKAAEKAEGDVRYPDHDSQANKYALLDVAKFRREKGITLSHPEETAFNNWDGISKPETGRKNITGEMPSGTAICHKISDNEIRTSINHLFKEDHEGALDSYLSLLVETFKPDHTKHNTPADADGHYNKEAQEKHKAAHNACERAKNTSGEERLRNAHLVGMNTANSPVNLFLGDSSTNSSIGYRLDGNMHTVQVLTDGILSSQTVWTPRTIETRNARERAYLDVELLREILQKNASRTLADGQSQTSAIPTGPISGN